MNNSSSPKVITICPHPNCAKPFDDVIYHHGMIFCPHCKNSLLANPFVKELEMMTFGQFVRYFIKTQWKKYLIVSGVFLFFIGIMLLVINFEKINLGAGFWITVSVFALILMGVGIYFIEKNLQKYHYDKIKNKPIIKGVDNYELVKNDFDISTTLEYLKIHFDRFSTFCPNCHSQRLHKDNNKFICQNCHHHVKLNSKLTHLQTISLIAQHIFMFIVIRYMGDSFYFLILFVPILFLIHLITQYYWFRTPKWIVETLP